MRDKTLAFVACKDNEGDKMEADNSCRKMGKQVSASIQIKDN